MTLNIIDDIKDGAVRLFKQTEELIAEHFTNPILWIAILAVILIIVAFAYNTLSKR